MLLVEFSEYGNSVPDLKTDEWANDVINNIDIDADNSITVGTVTMVNALRVLISSGKIPHDKILFKFNDDTITSNNRGQLSSWPEGFCDTATKHYRFLMRNSATKGNNTYEG